MKGSTLATILRRHRSRIAVAVTGVLLVALAVLAVRSPYWSHGCGATFSGMARTGTGECVGVVDSEELLDPELRGLFRLFAAENTAVADGPEPYVKVVLLTPLSLAPNKPSAMSLEQIRNSLEGTYTALWRINHERDFGDPTATKVQLVLANQGSRQDFNQRMIDDVLEVDEPGHPLVAIVGLGSSFVGAWQTAAVLGRTIPLMSAVASADSFNAQAIPGLHSVSPSTSAYVRALRKLLDPPKVLDLHKAILVADTNQDPYVQSLQDSFHTEMGAYNKLPPQNFVGGTTDNPAAPQVFQTASKNICAADGVDTVLYAGRVADFEAFAKSLEQRICPERELTVLVGATGFQSAQRYVDLLDRARITVVYASSSDAPAWSAGKPGTPIGFPRFAEQFRGRGFPADHLADGYAIAYHDALVTIGTAIRLAALNRTPTPADVNSQLSTLNLSEAVRAASGTLTFSIDTDGRATGKAIPYRQIGTATSIRLPQDLEAYRTAS